MSGKRGQLGTSARIERGPWARGRSRRDHFADQPLAGPVTIIKPTGEVEVQPARYVTTTSRRLSRESRDKLRNNDV